MVLFVAAVLACLGACAAAVPTSPTPRDVARSAVELYNQETATNAVFRLLKLKNVHKTKFEWGVHFSINFTVKETTCRKSMGSYRIENCQYWHSGQVRQCSAQVSVLDFVQEAPLTSVTCVPQQRVKPKAQAPREVTVRLPGSLSLAAQVVPEQD
ncbi:PREDICTED: kininogen-1-like [Gavialis gangeticus]|uniref:kininogen-1-like n=1 Tax=Gavialis gangeticus TaxID=94835 RepID=UPI00092FA3D6|nr:PREDICTED: kininogen-1-like [Gavialis gangeticus]